MSREKTLEIDNITKSFGENIAVKGLSFHMKEPGVFGLIGTNGAGKTTAIRCILGIMGSDGGEAKWLGKRITRDTLGFGYMPEERGVYMKIGVLAQLKYFGMLRGMGKAEAEESALGFLKRLNVEEYRDMEVEKLSKGNQQKIQLISTLVHDPDLIFLDEPFSGLDPINTENLRTLIEELVAEGKYIVMSSHQMNIVEDFCNDIALLHKGETILSGNLREIKEGYGRTNLIVEAGEDVTAIADRHGLRLIQKKANLSEYAIQGDAMAEEFLQSMLREGIYPIRYEIKEPSLHQIFIEKVGEKQ
ncbi:MAG: ABC transporter ATP-binding protein [Anaerovoracaceae bacterium]|jgi:ABC-2 type transport system ATP-binding protein